MSDSRFAVYLIPPYQLSKRVAEAHYLLRKQFGFTAADRFPVHCTMKGFFKKNQEPVDKLQAELDDFFKKQQALPVCTEELRIDPIGFGLSLMTMDGKINTPFLDLREEIIKIVFPYIAEDCDF